MQGCRPVGRIAKVTGAKGNAITHLDGQPALLVVSRLQLTETHLPAHREFFCGSGVISTLHDA